ncbi:neprilysin-1-like [Tubulanus polymorphus]|uniref:neprilysin-1-like n=1 Tax=Tubulanus polymorphus TaxID=672921 RepID=UPI003DA24F51
MNTTQIKVIGDGPLRKVLDTLDGWPVVAGKWDENLWNLEEKLAFLRVKYHAPLLVKSYVGIDDRNSSAYVLTVNQAGLGMPSRDYYLQDIDSLHINAYKEFMTNVAGILGADPIRAKKELAEDVLNFEIQLANITKSLSEQHDAEAAYEKMTLKQLRNEVPQIDWLKYFRGFIPAELDETEEVVVLAKSYLKNLGILIRKTPKRIISNYLLWRIVMAYAPELTDDFTIQRNMYMKVIQGVGRDKARWQKCVELVNERFGMGVGALFIRDNFKKESKDTALEMIHNIREAFNELLLENDWMDAKTKAVAKEKADAMNERIGYPEFITKPDELNSYYKRLEFTEDHFFDNVLKIEQFDAKRNFEKLRHSVDKNSWEQEPAIVNAFYNPNTNDIVFPAGILQPLFYSADFPKSLNYGGIGVVIGHEITHGFDDKGRQFDKDGNMRKWWTNETIEAFRNRAQCMIDQYSQFKLEPFGLPIDGRNTQGENIADNGGLKESYRAYQKWVEKNGEEQPLPGIGLTHNQLFFLNFAQIWCGNMRDEEALHTIRTSVHSPGQIRVLGPLSNSADFAKAYNCPKGSRMNPHHKCSVW